MHLAEVNLFPYETIKVNGIRIEYGRIPNGLVEGHHGIVFYFRTTGAYNTRLHEHAIKPLIKQIEVDSYNHGAYWDFKKCEAVIWNEYSQVTVATFEMRDSY